MKPVPSLRGVAFLCLGLTLMLGFVSRASAQTNSAAWYAQQQRLFWLQQQKQLAQMQQQVQRQADAARKLGLQQERQAKVALVNQQAALKAQRVQDKKVLQKINAPNSVARFGQLSYMQATANFTNDASGNPIKASVSMNVVSNYLPPQHLQFNVDFGALRRMGPAAYAADLDMLIGLSGYQNVVANYLTGLLNNTGN